MSAIEQNIVRQARLAGEKIPDVIKKKPRLAIGLHFFMSAFSDLRTERPSGMSIMPIPWSAIHYYAEVHSITGQFYDDLLYIIRAMDNAYLDSVGK